MIGLLATLLCGSLDLLPLLRLLLGALLLLGLLNRFAVAEIVFALVVGYCCLLCLGGAVVGVALENLLECYPIDDGLCISFCCPCGSLGVLLGNPAEDLRVHPGEFRHSLAWHLSCFAKSFEHTFLAEVKNALR